MSQWLLVAGESDTLLCLDTGALIEVTPDNTLCYRLPAERESHTLAHYASREQALAALQWMATQIDAVRPPEDLSPAA
ncbi:MAG: hypothetical protein P8Y95_06830 [Gammaproteobacteria bacterium]|jgi:hypothetical protein